MDKTATFKRRGGDKKYNFASKRSGEGGNQLKVSANPVQPKTRFILEY